MAVERMQATAHVVAKGMRIGIGAGVSDDGVTDALIFGFDDWCPTPQRVTDADEMFVVGVPFDIDGIRALAKALESIAHFLETGEVPPEAVAM